jgi:hypothetical protein
MFVGEIFYYYIFIQFLEVTTLPPLRGSEEGGCSLVYDDFHR